MIVAAFGNCASVSVLYEYKSIDEESSEPGKFAVMTMLAVDSVNGHEVIQLSLQLGKTHEFVVKLVAEL